MTNKIVLLILLGGLFWTPGLAQESQSAGSEQKTVQTMLDYRKELGLKDSQVTEIKDALTSFQTTVESQRSALAQQEKDFRQLLAAEAPLWEIESKLRQISDTRFNLRYADVLTSRRVNDALTDEQMDQWRQIQEKVRGGE